MRVQLNAFAPARARLRSTLRVAVRCLAFALALEAVAGAASASAAATPPPPSRPAASSPSAPAPPVTHVAIAVLRTRGNPPFLIAGQRAIVRGLVTPYVPGQKVKLSVYRDGRKVSVKTVPVIAIGGGEGQFHIIYSSSAAGLVQVRAVHYATPAQEQFVGRTRSIRVAATNLSQGAQGGSVWLLQAELAALHYDVPRNGSFEEATGRAVMAYRKLVGLERVEYTNTHIFQLLQQGAGRFHVRYRSDGRHVEADLTRQVLAEIEPGGNVRAIFEISSGKPSTPTVVGRFHVYEKTPGYNAKGMLDSNYFVGGYAIHGYAEVPNYPASHGCLRVPIPNASSIYEWVRIGTPVDVYDEYGGGSSHVYGNAGP
jgi:hypothetical protein